MFFNTAFFCILSVYAAIPLEDAVEISYVFVAAEHGDLQNRLVGFEQKSFCLLNADAIEHLMEAFARVFGEKPP